MALRVRSDTITRANRAIVCSGTKATGGVIIHPDNLIACPQTYPVDGELDLARLSWRGSSGEALLILQYTVNATDGRNDDSSPLLHEGEGPVGFTGDQFAESKDLLVTLKPGRGYCHNHAHVLPRHSHIAKKKRRHYLNSNMRRRPRMEYDETDISKS